MKQHEARIILEKNFEEDSLKTKDVERGVSVRLGNIKSASHSNADIAQAYYFDAQLFTDEAAKQWMREHHMSFSNFKSADVRELEELTVELDALKVGARNNTSDAKRIQSIHDMASTMGGCPVTTKKGARFSGSDMSLLHNLHDTALALGASCQPLTSSAKAAAAVTKSESDGEHVSSHYLVVEDASKPNTWHLRVKDSAGKVDAKLMGAAWAALHSGFRGNKYSGPSKSAALSKLTKLYKSENIDTPSAAKADTDSLDEMSSEVRQAFYAKYQPSSNSSLPMNSVSCWVREVFIDHIIAEYGDKTYSIDYSRTENATSGEEDIVFVEPTAWVEVEQEYVPVKVGDESLMLNFGSAVKVNETNGHIGGHLVTFSDSSRPDTTGEYFDKSTQFNITDGMKTPVYFHHTLALKSRAGRPIQVKEQIGEGVLSIDDEGVVIDAIIYNNAKYRAAFMKSIKSLGWSSGSASHLVTRERIGNAVHIKRWPLGLDASITPTPAELANVVTSVKSYSENEFDFDFQQDDDVLSIEDAASSSAARNMQQSLKGDIAMTQEELNKAIADGVKSGVEAIERARAEAALAVKAAEDKKKTDDEALEARVAEAVKTQLGRKQTANRAGVKVKEVKTNGDGKKQPIGGIDVPLEDDPFSAFGHFLKTGDAGGIRADDAYKTTYDLLEGTANQGLELVPTAVLDRIYELRDPISIMRAAGAEVIPVGTKTTNVPFEANRSGVFVIVGEGVAYDENAVQPLDKVALTVYKFTRTVQISEELLEDSVIDVTAWWSRHIARMLALTENQYFVTGSGSGQPQGVVTGGQSGGTSASATAVTAGEVIALYHSLTSEYRDAAVWMMKGATEGSVRALTGNPAYFVGNGGMSGGVGNTNFPQGAGWLVAPNARVYNAASMDSIAASKKPILVGNPSAGYIIAERRGLTVFRDPYSNSATGLLNVHASARLGGGVAIAEAFKYLSTPSA